jgi:hypothetical protein
VFHSVKSSVIVDNHDNKRDKEHDNERDKERDNSDKSAYKPIISI